MVNIEYIIQYYIWSILEYGKYKIILDFVKDKSILDYIKYKKFHIVILDENSHEM